MLAPYPNMIWSFSFEAVFLYHHLSILESSMEGIEI